MDFANIEPVDCADVFRLDVLDASLRLYCRFSRPWLISGNLSRHAGWHLGADLDISDWLNRIGLSEHLQSFLDSKIDIDVLPDLDEADLRDLGIPLGHRKRIMRAVRDLMAGEAAEAAEPSPDGGQAETESAQSGPQRRHLTVMFCDLVDSTALSVELDPEDMRDVILRFQNACVAAAKAFGGFVAAHMGDGMLIYFGYPRADEHDPERAVRTGLEIAGTVPMIETPSGARLSCRIGIATGRVVVGDTVGSEGSQKHEVVGEAPNLAARLQAMAGKNQVAISDDTRRLVPGLFELIDLGRHHVKGFAEDVQAWQVLAARSVEDRFSARRGASDLTDLTGRDEEFSLLKRRWKSACRGEGQAVMISGDAGIGKSRLVQALRESIDEVAVRYRSCYCSPYHANSALFPIIDLIHRQTEIRPEMPARERLDRLRALLEGVGKLSDDSLRVIASLISIPAEDLYTPAVLSPQRLMDLTLETLVGMIKAATRHSPIVFVFEDLHWIDPTTEEFLDRLIRDIEDMPVLVIASFRPSYMARWSDLPHVTTIPLTRLNTQLSIEAINRVAGKPLPAEIVAQIVEKTDGVPLYIEEVTRTLLDSGHLVERKGGYELDGDLPIRIVPDTLQDSLMARLDQLSTVKDVALIASVIGRRFSYRMLAAIADLPVADLDSGLRRLVDAQLLFQRGSIPDATFLFKHSLVQDAAYASLLRSRRQELHGRIADALDQDFRELANEQPEFAAHHCEHAGMVGAAIGHLKRAGARFLRQSASAEALNHLTRVRGLLDQLTNEAEREREELEILLMQGAGYTTTRGWAVPEAEEAYLRAKQICDATEDRDEHFPVYLALHRFHALRGELPQADEVGERLLASAATSNDVGYVMPANVAHGYNSFFMGKLARADHHLEAGIALYDPKRHDFWISRWGEDPGIVALGFRSLVACLQDQTDMAVDLNRRGLGIARDCGHHFSIGFSLWITTRLYQMLDRKHAVLEPAEELLALSTDQDMPAWLGHALIMRGWAMAMTGKGEAGISSINDGLAADLGAGALLHRTHYLALLADACRENGRIDEGERRIAEAKTYHERTAEGYAVPEIFRIEAELLGAKGGDPRAIEACIDQAIASAREIGAKLWERAAERTRESLFAA